MDYSGKITKTHLLSFLSLSGFFLVILSFTILCSGYVVCSLQKLGFEDSLVLEKKRYLKDSVDRIISAIESDLAFCRDQIINVEQAECDETIITEMARKRIGAMSLVDGGYIQVNDVNDSLNADYTAFQFLNIVLPDERNPGILKAKYSDAGSSDEKDSSRNFFDNGEIFLKYDVRESDSEEVGHKLGYVRYYERLDWIISADINLKRQAEYSYTDFLSSLFNKTRQLLVPFFLFVIIAFSIVYFFHGRIKKVLESQKEDIDFGKEQLRDREKKLLSDIEKKKQLNDDKNNFLEQLLLASDNVAIIITDSNFEDPKIIECSSGAVELLGWDGKEIIGQKYSDLFDPDIVTEQLRLLQDTLLLEKGYSGESLFCSKNGKNIPVEFSLHPFRSLTGEIEGVITVALDNSRLAETRKSLSHADQRLLHAHKMEAIGTLASGIAHDFNNVLSSIVGYSELLKDEFEEGSQQRQDLDQILRASSRASGLVKQILSFSRKAELGSGYFEPAVIIKETLKMLRPTIPSTVEIKQDIQAAGEVIYANSSQIHQLFMNLCTNAYQAMEDSNGVLEVALHKTARKVYFPESYTSDSQYFLELTVTDSGSGIAPEIRDKIFDPFFTTRNSSGGSGMGLSNVSNIVSLIGGTIWFDDIETGGTRFHVLFPVKDELTSSAGSLTTSEVAARGGSETILYVDDEPDITKMAKAMLGGMGYTVYGCYSGPEALDFFKNKQDEIDLIITDQTMPGLTGAELTRKIREFSSVPIILTTGYSSKISEDNWSKYGVSGFVMKPYRKVDIARHVRAILDS